MIFHELTRGSENGHCTHLTTMFPQHAAATATDITLGHDPAKSYWDVSGMKEHLLSCLEAEETSLFPNELVLEKESDCAKK